MRVYYKNGCGKHHDELAAGQPRFERARSQGDKQPLFDLLWSGIKADTTLVVEALDQGCPYAGTYDFSALAVFPRDIGPLQLS